MIKTYIMGTACLAQGSAREVETLGHVCMYKANWFPQLQGLPKQASCPSTGRWKEKVRSQLEIHELEPELKLGVHELQEGPSHS